LKIDLFEDASGIHLTFEDSGEGIDSSNLAKIFDPFFTTRSFKNHMGLGLSAAFGVLKEHNAEVKVTSERGFGAKVMITFKKQQAVSVLKAPPAVSTLSDEKTPIPTPLAAPTPTPEPEKIQVQGEILKLKDESPHREEAEAEFVEVKMQSSVGNHSPLDVNIDKLLDMADEPTVIQVSDRKKDESADESSNPPDLDFVDSAMSEERTVIAAAAPIDDEFTPVNLINAPPAATPAKKEKSKLDGYQVEIRRPGKRT
jgi:hypothetical protein